LILFLVARILHVDQIKTYNGGKVMNKIKAIYDVVKTMKEKTEREGVLQIHVEKDGQQVLRFSSEFQRSGDGNTKCHLQSEWNCDGNEGKHESTTEFKRDHEHGCPFHKGFRHGRHHGHFGHGHGHGPGFKSKADILLCFLKMLNELKVEEQGEKILFSLELDEAAAKMKEKMKERKQGNGEYGPFHGEYPGHHHPLKGKLMKELMLMEKPQISVSIAANKNKEVEKVTITIQGSYQNEGLHETNATVEIHFTK
jgi:hypothetical protein